MNNLLSYCGLVDAKIRASDKDLPVQLFQKELTEMLPPDAHLKASNKVHISLTGFDVALNNFAQPWVVSVLNCKKWCQKLTQPYFLHRIEDKKHQGLRLSLAVFELNRAI